MKVGNLVKWQVTGGEEYGIVIGWDDEGDPIVRSNNGVFCAHWSHSLEVIG